MRKQGYLFSALLLVFSLFVTTWAETQNKFTPKVYNIDINSGKSKQKHSYSSFIRFDDTPNLVVVSSNNKIELSENYGVDWETPKGLENLGQKEKHKKKSDSYTYIVPDSHYPSKRAYVLSYSEENHKIYYTNDAGKTWGLWDLTSVITKFIKKNFSDVDTNRVDAVIENLVSSSFDEKYLIASVYFNADKYGIYADFDFISFDFGKTWNLVSPVEDLISDSTKQRSVRCDFSAKDSENSNSNKLFCLYEENEEFELEEDADDFESGYKHLGSLYESNDLGKSWKKTEDLKDLNVVNVEITKNYIFAYVIKDAFNSYSSTDIYISNDGGKKFTKAVITNELRGDFKNKDVNGMYLYVVDDIIILTAHLFDNSEIENDNNGHSFRYSQPVTFISDTTGSKFYSLDEIIGDDSQKMMTSVFSLEALKGTFMFESLKMVPLKDSDEGDDNNSSMNRGMDVVIGETKITFDDGYSWLNVKVNPLDNSLKDSITLPCDPSDDIECTFKSFSGFFSPEEDRLTTPGIFTKNGMVSRGDLAFGDGTNVITFVTRDGGRSFDACLNFSTSVAMGDYGNILVAVPILAESDGDKNSEIYYSLDQGKSWEEYQFDYAFVPLQVTPVVMDGSGFHFLVTGLSYEENRSNLYSSGKEVKFIIDFSDVHGGTQCDKEKDMEIWELNNGECIDGVKHSYKRRKQLSECSVKSLYEDIKDESTVCECTEKDFECGSEFYRDFSTGKCVLDHNLLTKVTDQTCRNSKDKLSLPVKALKSNNACKNPENVEVETQELACEGLGLQKGDEKILMYENDKLDSEPLTYQYFNSLKSESLMIQTKDKSVFYSTDGGVSLRKFDTNGEKVVETVFNKYHDSYAYILGSKNSLFTTNDSALSFQQYSSVPKDSRQLMFPLDFHAKDPNQFIYYGGKNCDTFYDPNCYAVAYYTQDGGATFNKLLDYALHCEYSGSLFGAPADQNLIMCEVRKPGEKSSKLLSSTDYFERDTKQVFDNVVGFASYSQYTVIAVVENKMLKGHVTIDGKEFADISLPKVYDSVEQTAFTVLGASKGALFFHLTTNYEPSQEYGALMKSNSNGTNFVTIERAVNRNQMGFIDFEHTNTLEGIFLINTVSNFEDLATDKKMKKKLRTKITFNDGAEFRYMKAPTRDSNNKKYSCDVQDINSCSLNLHGFTEREDVRDTYGSGSATGVMIGVGNVGDELKPFDECGTFMTVDGGATWKELQSEPYQWEYGDRGSVIVLVKSKKETDSVIYSKDSGKTWNEFKFSSTPVNVLDILTHPIDASLKFFLIIENKASTVPKTITLDFAELFSRQCVFNFAESRTDDYDYFPFQNPDSKCLFGHEIEYLKKIRDDCYVGMAPLSQSYRITANCSCTRGDFECDYNYYRANDGTCKLVDGLSAADPLEMCAKDENLIEFFMPTGYRKIPLSTCKGGKELDKWSSVPKACPGKEKEFRQLHSMSGMSKFFVIILPIFVMIFAIWFVYDRGIRRNGGFSRFGEIRLNDEDDLVEETLSDVIVNNIVRFGVFSFQGMSSLYVKAKKPLSSFLGKVAGLFGVSTSFQNGPRYSTLIHEQFMDDADDLLSGHDEDANDIATFSSSDVNFDINNVSDDEHNFGTHSSEDEEL